MTEPRNLEYFYRNIHFSYQNVRFIQELSCEAATCEHLTALEKVEGKNKTSDGEIPTAAAVYNRDEYCWRK